MSDSPFVMFKKVSLDKGDFRSLFRDDIVYTFGVTYRQQGTEASRHRGGFYVCDTIQDALCAPVPSVSDNPRPSLIGVLAVDVQAPFHIGGGVHICRSLTPTELVAISKRDYLDMNNFAGRAQAREQGLCDVPLQDIVLEYPHELAKTAAYMLVLGAHKSEIPLKGGYAQALLEQYHRIRGSAHVHIPVFDGDGDFEIPYEPTIAKILRSGKVQVSSISTGYAGTCRIRLIFNDRDYFERFSPFFCLVGESNDERMATYYHISLEDLDWIQNEFPYLFNTKP